MFPDAGVGEIPAVIPVDAGKVWVEGPFAVDFFAVSQIQSIGPVTVEINDGLKCFPGHGILDQHRIDAVFHCTVIWTYDQAVFDGVTDFEIYTRLWEYHDITFHESGRVQ